MKSVAVYIAGMVVLSPCLLLASNNIFGAFIAIVWGVVLYHSPKFSPIIKKFWREVYKVNYLMFRWFTKL